jgi:cell division septum initiation protein DivIVA
MADVGTAASGAASSAASAASGFASSMSGIGAGVQAATAIASTIAGINDMNKRRQTETALSYLTSQQQDQLNRDLLKAKTQTERMQILSSAIVNYAIANETSQDKQQTMMYILAGVMGVSLLVCAIYLMKSKN